MASEREPREIVRKWLNGLMDRHRLSSPRAIAKKAGISPTTVYRWLDPDAPFETSLSKLRQVAKKFGERLPAELGLGGEPAEGFSEGDLVAFVGAAAELPAKPEHNVGRWRITNEVLNLEGFRPGDIVDFDLQARPQRGDIVVAQVYDQQQGTAETVLRQYQPPYLVTRSSDPTVDARILAVDGEEVIVRGVFLRMTRTRG